MNISIQAKIFIYLFFIVSKSKRRQDIIYLSSMWWSISQKTKAQHAGANAWLQLLLENSKVKKGHNCVKKILRGTCPTGMGSLFEVNNNSEFQSKYLL